MSSQVHYVLCRKIINMHELLIKFTFLILGTFCFYKLLLNSEKLWSPIKSVLYIPRKDTNRTVMLLGGLPIYIASLTSVLFIMDDFDQVITWVIPATIMAIAGYVDDKFTLKPSTKLAFQVLAVGSFSILAASAQGNVNTTEFFLYMFWGLGVINGANLLDGIDSYSAKYNLGTMAGFVALGYHFGFEQLSILSLFLMAPVAVFYYFNKYPAKIFLGEIGVSILGLNTLFLVTTMYHAINPQHLVKFDLGQFFLLVSLAHLPMTELGISLLRRAVCFKSSPFKKDHTHLHHILTKFKGSSHSKTSSILFSFHFAGIVIHLLTSHYVNPVVSFWTTGMYYVGYYLSFGLKYWLPETVVAKFSQTPSAPVANLNNVIELAPFRKARQDSVINADKKDYQEEELIQKEAS